MIQALMNRCCSGLKDVRYGRAWLQASILFSLTWTVGGALESESQIKFDTFVRSLLSGNLFSKILARNPHFIRITRRNLVNYKILKKIP